MSRSFSRIKPYMFWSLRTHTKQCFGFVSIEGSFGETGAPTLGFPCPHLRFPCLEYQSSSLTSGRGGPGEVGDAEEVGEVAERSARSRRSRRGRRVPGGVGGTGDVGKFPGEEEVVEVPAGGHSECWCLRRTPNRSEGAVSLSWIFRWFSVYTVSPCYIWPLFIP